jgi:hypothetical protein
MNTASIVITVLALAAALIFTMSVSKKNKKNK